jgi:hypothetical protein
MHYINSFKTFINESDTEWQDLVLDLKSLGWKYNDATDVASTTYVSEYGERKIEITNEHGVIMWNIYDSQGNLLSSTKFNDEFLGEGFNWENLIY